VTYIVDISGGPSWIFRGFARTGGAKLPVLGGHVSSDGNDPRRNVLCDGRLVCVTRRGNWGG
jgi:hypothetical protein